MTPDLHQSENLRRHVDSICGIHPRSQAYPDNLNRVAGYIRDVWGNSGLRVFEQEFSRGGQTYRNLRVRFDRANADPHASHDKPLLIGAHYDAVETTPGADDNASGVAAILELGALLKRNPPPVAVELIAFANEERPSFGTMNSGAFQDAKRRKDTQEDILGMISLEMIGFFSNDKNTQNFPMPWMKWLYPTRANFLAFVSIFGNTGLVLKARQKFKRHCDFPTEWFVGPKSVEGLLNSDHLAYLSFGYNAMMITDTAYYRNPHYHQPTDRPETLNYPAMSTITDGLQKMIQNWSSR